MTNILFPSWFWTFKYKIKPPHWLGTCLKTTEAMSGYLYLCKGIGVCDLGLLLTTQFRVAEEKHLWACMKVLAEIFTEESITPNLNIGVIVSWGWVTKKKKLLFIFVLPVCEQSKISCTTFSLPCHNRLEQLKL